MSAVRCNSGGITSELTRRRESKSAIQNPHFRGPRRPRPTNCSAAHARHTARLYMKAHTSGLYWLFGVRPKHESPLSECDIVIARFNATRPYVVSRRLG